MRENIDLSLWVCLYRSLSFLYFIYFWWLYTCIYFNHIPFHYPLFFPSHPRWLPPFYRVLHSFFSFLWPPMFNQGCTSDHGWGLISWGMGDLPASLLLIRANPHPEALPLFLSQTQGPEFECSISHVCLVAFQAPVLTEFFRKIESAKSTRGWM